MLKESTTMKAVRQYAALSIQRIFAVLLVAAAMAVRVHTPATGFRLPDMDRS